MRTDYMIKSRKETVLVFITLFVITVIVTSFIIVHLNKSKFSYKVIGTQVIQVYIKDAYIENKDKDLNLFGANIPINLKVPKHYIIVDCNSKLYTKEGYDFYNKYKNKKGQYIDMELLKVKYKNGEEGSILNIV